MKIVLQPHLKIRLKERNIPQSYPKKIILNSEGKYHDALSGHKISIKEFEYYDKVRPMAAVYDIIEEEIQVITVFATSYQDIETRLKNGRWVKDEKN